MSATDTDPNEAPRPSRAKWESELEEILAAADREPTAVDKARSRMITARYQAPAQMKATTSRIRSRMTTGAWLLLFLGFTVGAYALRHVSPLLGRALAIAAVLLLIVIVIKALTRPSSAGGESKTWRGRDMSSENPSFQSWRSRLFNKDRDT